MPRLLSGKIIIYLLVLLAADLCLLPAFGAFRPVLTYLWVLYIAFHGELSEILPAALLAGGLRDLVGSQPFGVETTSLGLVAAALVFFRHKLQMEFFPIRLIVTAFFVLSSMLANIVLTGFLSSNASFSWYALFACFAAAAASTLVMPFFFSLTAKWFSEKSRGLKQYELFG